MGKFLLQGGEEEWSELIVKAKVGRTLSIARIGEQPPGKKGGTLEKGITNLGTRRERCQGVFNDEGALRDAVDLPKKGGVPDGKGGVLHGSDHAQPPW